ncbi:MAG TPA: FtsQ-type POTRA domain-containing protein [Caldilineaceae bacterium]|nr:FtsQ-type POTRA domain-containing protein [Caldilineaceae bacterium]
MTTRPGQYVTTSPYPPRSRRRRQGTLSLHPYRQARRKRTLTRQMRRLEVALSAVPTRLHLDRALQAAAVVQGSGWHPSKLLSALLLAAALATLGMLHTQDAWFVYAEDVHFEHVKLLRADALYAASEVEGWNIFWLQPQEVRRRLLAHPWIEDARVLLKLPGSVTVQIQEAKPVAVWITNAGNYWLAADGAALPMQAEMDSVLPQIVDTLQEARRWTADGTLAIDPQVLSSALALVQAVPELEGKVRYNRMIGLNFPLPKSAVWVYWGDGFHMEEKLEKLAIARDLLRTSDEPAQIVDIRFVDRPYLR